MTTIAWDGKTLAADKQMNTGNMPHLSAVSKIRRGTYHGMPALFAGAARPIKLRIQNHGTASLTYVPYSVTTASGIALPTATASHLLTPQGEAVVSGKAYEGIFYRAPNISIGASGNQEVIIEVWGRTGTE